MSDATVASAAAPVPATAPVDPSPAEATPATQPAPAAAAAPAPGQEAPKLELDLAFCCDCTGSMGAYIRAAQDNIRTIAERIAEAKGNTCSIRYSLVKYRDHPPQDTSFITEVFPFTKSLTVMKANIDTMSANGGGDGPEAVTAALHEVLHLDWRESSAKVCVFIADAPPHGLGESGDGFPEGCPLGYDPVAICRGLAEKGVTVYAVGVEPVLSTSYKFARDFMMMVAKVTEGKFLPLGKADVLARVIVSTALEGLELTHLWNGLEAEVRESAKANNEALSETEMCTRVEQLMAAKKDTVLVHDVEVANPYMANYDMFNVAQLEQATSLKAARQMMSAQRNESVAAASAGYAWHSQAVCDAPAMPMKQEQMSRAAAHGKKKHGVWS